MKYFAYFDLIHVGKSVGWNGVFLKNKKAPQKSLL